MMISGQMWNHIRGPPYAHRNPQTGEIVCILLLIIIYIIYFIFWLNQYYEQKGNNFEFDWFGSIYIVM